MSRSTSTPWRAGSERGCSRPRRDSERNALSMTNRPARMRSFCRGTSYLMSEGAGTVAISRRTMPEPLIELVELGARGRVRSVDREIFRARFAPDCMTHECRCRDEGDRRLLDACCQHGADVD